MPLHFTKHQAIEVNTTIKLHHHSERVSIYNYHSEVTRNKPLLISLIQQNKQFVLHRLQSLITSQRSNSLLFTAVVSASQQENAVFISDMITVGLSVRRVSIASQQVLITTAKENKQLTDRLWWEAEVCVGSIKVLCLALTVCTQGGEEVFPTAVIIILN